MLYKKCFVFVLAFLIASCSSSSIQNTQSNDLLNLPQIGKGATVAFVTKSIKYTENDEIKTYPYCTGVWISHSVILTALHCARGAATMEEVKKLPLNVRKYAPLFVQRVTDPTGTLMNYSSEQEVIGIGLEPKKTHNSRVIAIDPKHDLALVKSDDDMPYHNWLKIADYMPKVGEHVFIIGNPAGLYFTYMSGEISALRTSFPKEDIDDEMEGPYVQIHSSIFGGNSGGPVISEKGEIIGIVSFISEAPNQGFAITISSIKKFLNKNL